MATSVGPQQGAIGGGRVPRRRRFGIAGLLVCAVLFYAVVAALDPWAMHMGGSWTPLLYWTGTGNLVTSNGTYPIYVWFFPGSHFSQLHMDGLRPTGGIQGGGSLCESAGKVVPLRLSGTIRGGWKTTEGALIEVDFRVLEKSSLRQAVAYARYGGYFRLFGYWHGAKLTMDDRAESSTSSHLGTGIQHASLILTPGSKSDFDTACQGRR